MSSVQRIDRELMDSLLARAAASPRRRVNHNFHANLDEPAHRFLNVMLRGTYVTPHRHVSPPKPEGFLVLRGTLAALTFDDDGNILTRDVLGGDVAGVDIAAGVWHTIVVLSDYAVCYEVKPGPYAAAVEKDFAPWAPREGDPRTADYLHHLEISCNA